MSKSQILLTAPGEGGCVNCGEKASGSGRWIRQGKQIVVLLGDDSAQQGEMQPGFYFEDDFELLGEICRGFEIDSADYIKWVQRSLNRILGSGIVVDGKPSEKYRNAVQQFQQQHGLAANGQVDSKTQNKLILANEANADYVKWVQKALNTDGAGLVPDGNMGSSSSRTKKAIRAYQTKRTPALCVDGFLGAKTELFLMGESGTRPPGHIEPVESPPVRRKPVGARIETLTIWLNAFIPHDLPKPWTHKPFAGPHAGKVFLPSPGRPADLDFYATDQRSWSTRLDASSRLHSRVDIVIKGREVASVARKRVGETIRVDRFGKVQCKKRAPVDGIKISQVRQVSANLLRFLFSGKGLNPCTPSFIPTAAIDYALEISITLSPDRQQASIRVTGAIDEFPSFEMYAAVNNDFNAVVTLFRRRASNDPKALIGGAVRKIDVSRNVIPHGDKVQAPELEAADIAGYGRRPFRAAHASPTML